MKARLYIPALIACTGLVSAVVGVRPNPVLAAPKKAICEVCREGEEPVKATAVHQGKEHYFCSEKCKKEFLADPASFLKSLSPRPAPAFTLKDLNGKSVSLADYKGKVVLLDFWATFCAPCIKAMPKLQKLNDRYAGRGFAVIGIATDEEGAALVAPTAAKTKVSYPILLTAPSTWKEYDVKTLPALFLIDRSGQIVKQFGGNTEEKSIEQEVRKLLGE